MVHAPVLGAELPIGADRMPSEGPLAFAPNDSPMAQKALQHYSTMLGQSHSQLEIQSGEAGVNEETRAIIWLDPSAKGIETLDKLLAKYKSVGWVQLPMAGITHYLPVVQKYPKRLWTSCKVGSVPFSCFL
jgi:hypothetical protein